MLQNCVVIVSFIDNLRMDSYFFFNQKTKYFYLKNYYSSLKQILIKKIISVFQFTTIL